MFKKIDHIISIIGLTSAVAGYIHPQEQKIPFCKTAIIKKKKAFLA